MNKKNKLFGLLAVIGCAALTAGFGLQVTANAEEKKLGGVDVSSFRMAYGASVRFNPNATEEKTGIRFIANLSDEAYTDLQELGGVTYGMVIVPADIVKTNPLNLENLFGVNAVYCFEDPKEEGEEEGCTCTKQHIASVQYTTLAEGEKNDGLKDLRGSLVDIKEDNYTREFIGMAYMEYNGTYVLADNAYGENDKIPDVKNNTRSMAYVAQLAIEDNQDDSKNTLYNTYLKELAETYEFAYTVNHYLPDENGDYGDPVEETAWGTLNEEVEAKHITSSTVDNKENYVGYRIYAFGKNSNTKDIVYANGKTVLNCYYEKIDTTLLDCSTDETIEVDGKNYSYLEYANLNVGDVKNGTYSASVENLASVELAGETRTGVTKVEISGENNAWYSGKLALALPNAAVKQANDANWDYISVHMLVQVYNGETTLTMGSFNNSIGTITAGVWQELIIPKSELNKKGNYVWWGSNPTDLNKATFDSKFSNTYFNTSSALFLNTTSVKTSTVDTANGETDTVTYYIDKIEWGVNTVAPEIEATVYDKVYTGTFNPTVTVTDDLNKAPQVKKTVYKLVDEVRTEVPAEADGTWNLAEVGKYILVVKADDSAFADVEGNVAIREYAFETIVEPTRTTGYIVDFDIPSETNYVMAKVTSGVTPVVSHLDSYVDANGISKNGVVKYETTSVAGNTWGAYFYMNLGTDKITEIYNAYIDATTDFTLSITLCVEMSKYIHYAYATENDCENPVFLYGGKGYTGAFEGGQWITLSFNETELARIFGWSTTSATATQKDLNGVNDFFHMEGWTLTSTLTNVTYYIDSISYSTTPVVTE